MSKPLTMDETQHHITTPSIPVVILAGGESRRLKPLLDKKGLNRKWQLPFGDSHLLDFLINKLKKHHQTIMVNTGPMDHQFGFEPYSDVISDLKNTANGPLAGLLSAIHWAKQHHFTWVGTCACDTPFIPDDIYYQLLSFAESRQSLSAIAESLGQSHPTCGIWHTDLLDALFSHIDEDKKYSLMRWIKLSHTTTLNYKDDFGHDPFLNINTPRDYKNALRRLDGNIETQ